ncbi:hypothetical protein [Marinobacter gelidimuriae]|uniref:hypothetical protein n=1 Tax=Marinobacter gelidimuriae TaxID=2739064 RepID=UPI0003673FE1|nr:hypothetical protein [Marinobacter gelidimuriae]
MMIWEIAAGLFMNPVVISFNEAISIAIIGLIVNGVSAWILGDDHNRQAAYFHVLADALTCFRPSHS